MNRKLTAFLLVALTAAGSFGQTHRLGPWAVDGATLGLSYGEKRLVERLEVGFWSANYAKGLFGGSWQAEARDGKLVFTCERAALKAVLVFARDGEHRLKQTLELDFRQTPGPFEYGFVMNPANFAVGENRSVLKLNGEYTEVTDDRFASRGGPRFSWETPEASYQFENLSRGMGFQFQDRRTNGKGLFRYIACTAIDYPRHLTLENTWTVNSGFEASTIAVRRQTLAKPLNGGVALAVANAGFEAGAEGWSLPANAAIDAEVAHTGGKSVRIAVTKPTSCNVYVTRLVPVEAGGQYRASCWLKTLGVEQVPEGEAKIGQVGATLIVEWANKKGRWIQGGSYARGLWGTNDWRRLTTERVTAPPEAGFAYVYLTLRAKGTAWFDDFKLEKLSYAVSKKAPTESATLASNTPLFAWRPVPGWRRYEVELSRKADFPKAATRRYSVGGINEFRLEEPLEPGTWFWKVVTRGMDDLLPSSFTVTAAKTADTLPPIVETRAARIVAGDATFEASVKETTAEIPSVEAHLGAATVQGAFTRRTAEGVLTYSFAPPTGGWPKGFTEGTLSAVDKAGNRETKPFYLLNAPPPENAVVVDGAGNMREDGRRIFPFGIYEVAPEDLADVRRTGFDAVHQYRWEGSHDDASCRHYLDQCWQTDRLRAFIGFDRGNGTGDGLVQGNFAHVARRVGALADHPGIFCWYLFDEPELMGQFIAPDLLIAYADLIRALDPYHPVVMTTWNSTMIEYRRSWDTHWTQAYGDPAATLSRLEQERHFLKNDSPITLLIYSGDMKQSGALRRGIKPDPEKFFPDYDALRACAFLGVARECNGLWMWWFARRCSDYYTVAHNAKAWANVGKILDEMKRLRPIITADEPARYGLAKAGGATIAWWVKRVKNDVTFIAVNTSAKPVTVEIDLPELGKRKLSFARYEVKNETTKGL